MPVMEVKGVRIGEGRPKTIVSLMDADEAQLRATCERALHEGADLLEWRADYRWPDVTEPEAFAEACLALSEHVEVPLVFTCRTKGQGGQAEMTCDEYLAVLRSVITQGRPDLVDIELWVGDDAVRELVGMAHEHGIVAIVSHHDFEGVPSVDEMEALLWHMVGLGADIPKLAVMAHRSQDAHDLMRATHLVYERAEVPLLAMAMGTAGQTTRLTGEVFGSALTFCALGRASAPGQVELSEAIATLEGVHRSVVRGEVG